MSSEKSCFNCTRAKKYPGTSGGLHEPPQPPEADCTLDYAQIEDALEMAAEAENIYAGMANHCGHYDPEIVEACAHCGKEIGEPVWLWKWWAAGWGMEPVCSEACQEAHEQVFAKSIEAEA